MYSDLPLVSTSHLDARKQVPTASGTGILVVGAVPCYNLKVSSPRTVSAVVRRRPADSPALSPSDFSKAGPCAAFFLQTTYLLKKAGLVWAFFLVSPAPSVPFPRLAFPLLLRTRQNAGSSEVRSCVHSRPMAICKRLCHVPNAALEPPTLAPPCRLRSAQISTRAGLI